MPRVTVRGSFASSASDCGEVEVLPVAVTPRITRSGIVTSFASAADSVAVTVTGDPSATGFGAADSRIQGLVEVSTMVIAVNEDRAPAPTS